VKAEYAGSLSLIEQNEALSQQNEALWERASFCSMRVRERVRTSLPHP